MMNGNFSINLKGNLILLVICKNKFVNMILNFFFLNLCDFFYIFNFYLLFIVKCIMQSQYNYLRIYF